MSYSCKSVCYNETDAAKKKNTYENRMQPGCIKFISSIYARSISDLRISFKRALLIFQQVTI